MRNSNEIDENTLEFARKFKKKLRFDSGQIVYLLSDVKKKCPMVIEKFWLHEDDFDYVVIWTTSQKELKVGMFLDKILTQ